MTYYRLHWADCPEFTADNAWSKPWGAEVNPQDHTQHECTQCPGPVFGPDEDCTWCEGTGWMDARRGYSCVDSAQELAEYLREWSKDLFTDPALAAGARVIEFDGRFAGLGDHDESLVIPTKVVREMTWTQFLNEEVTTE